MVQSLELDVLDELEETEQLVRSDAQTISGKISVSAPLSFGVAHLAPAIAAFMFQHPEIKVDVTMSDRRIDLIDEGIDIGIRKNGRLYTSGQKVNLQQPHRLRLSRFFQ